jgi:hypothetical protein
MAHNATDKPVVLIIFNRPEMTARVLSKIAEARPQKLFVIADGPRAGRRDDQEGCSVSRKLVESIDWPCTVTTNYSETNLGCRERVASGLTWVFEQVEQAIILEDDCVPDPTFFRYCAELLDRYCVDERIMMISGQNLQFGKKRGAYSYYFSRYSHIWGWATWRRAWRHYDVDMNLWPRIRDEDWIRLLIEDRQAAARWCDTFERMHQKQVDTWDMQWMFACWIQRGLCLVPNVNLVSNIGFGPTATHTTHSGGFLANLPTQPMEFPLHHPPFVIRHREADTFLECSVYHLSAEQKIRRAIDKFLRMMR